MLLMKLSLLKDSTKTMLTISSSTYSFTYLNLIFTCVMHDVVVILLAANMVPMLFTHTMTGYLTKIFMLPKSCITNTTSLSASDKGIYFASELESDTFLQL